MTTRRYLFASLILSFLGAVVGAYLTWVHYNLDALFCGTGQCEVVQTRPVCRMVDAVPVGGHETLP
jgi:hypothetical protein